MKPAPFDYALASSIDEAVQLLADRDGDAIILAGGQTLMPMLSMRLARPELVVDINEIAELSGILDGPDGVTIMACTRQVTALTSLVVHQRLPLLTRAISNVGHLQTRNRGTVGGSLAHADPAAEIPLTALTLDAEVTLCRVGASRRVAMADYFLGPMMTAREPEELLVSLHFPVGDAALRWGCSFHEVSERHGDFAIVAVAAQIGLDGDGVCRAAAVAFGGVDACPLRIGALEAALIGQVIGAAMIPGALTPALDTIAGAIDPSSDQHASAGYRRRVARTLAERTITEAAAEADGGGA